MDATKNAMKSGDSYNIVGETLTPMLTNAMGSAIEVFDTRGVAGGGPPPHKHRWEEIYVVLSGEMDVLVDGKTTRLGPGQFAHVPADTPHGYTTLTDTHFLTILSKGNGATFYKDVATEVEMNPLDIPGLLRVGAKHGVTFLT
jgi:quercetin dioxygenase-like cupin family protein